MDSLDSPNVCRVFLCLEATKQIFRYRSKIESNHNFRLNFSVTVERGVRRLSCHRSHRSLNSPDIPRIVFFFFLSVKLQEKNLPPWQKIFIKLANEDTRNSPFQALQLYLKPLLWQQVFDISISSISAQELCGCYQTSEQKQRIFSVLGSDTRSWRTKLPAPAVRS